MTRDMIFAFIGGTVVGAAGCYGVMTKLGYIRLSPEELTSNDSVRAQDDPKGSLILDHESTETVMFEDKTSYEQNRSVDTMKVRYDTLEEKPDLDEMAKKYTGEKGSDGDDPGINEDEEAIKNWTSEEYEEEDNDDPDPDLADVIHTDEEDIEYGHVVTQLPARRKDQLIFLVHEDYAGECYLLEDLIYYETDDVLADVTDAPVDDQLGVIGDSLGYFGKYSEDPDKLFVRNCSMGIEYEITREHRRYADKLYGVDSSEVNEEPKKGVRKMKKERDDE